MVSLNSFYFILRWLFPFCVENDRILERLASNEEDSTSWPELRKIIKQKLALVVESLATRQQSEEASKLKSEQQAEPEKLGTDTIGSSPRVLSDEEFLKQMGPAARSVALRRMPESKGEPPASDEEAVEANGNESAETSNGAPANQASEAGAEEDEAKTPTNDEPETTPEVPTKEYTAPPTPTLSSLGSGDAQDQVAADAQASPVEPETPKVPGAVNGSSTSEEDEGERARDIRDLERRIAYCLRTFDEAPFTIQRIAELLTSPERHYRSVMKFLRAVERVVFVTSTVEEFPTTTHPRDNEEDAAIEDGIRADAPSSLFSFLASQEVHSLSASANGSRAQHLPPSQPGAAAAAADSGASTVVPGSNNATMATSPVLTTSGQSFAARLAGSPTMGFVSNGSTSSAGGSGSVRSPRPSELQREVESLKLAPGSSVVRGNPPLDASDTGILHITPGSLEEENALRSKIRSWVAGCDACSPKGGHGQR
ncbi:PPP4R2-domain-containing protein [Martensiomyces pterosporus]|nr:PPP4R2-domain-containing protein [Martensiomyces pterosporus]